MSDYTKNKTRRERRENDAQHDNVGDYVARTKRPYKRPAQDVKDYIKRLNRGWM